MNQGIPAPEITEYELIHAFHWTPSQIAEIPYKKLQKYFVIASHKREIEDGERKREAWKSQANSAAKSMSRGGVSYREV